MSADLLSHIRIVLSHTSHPGNIGAAARAMKTMGIVSLYLVNPKKPIDAEAEAMASGASDVLRGARICASLAEALQGTVYALAVSARRRELAHVSADARSAAQRLVAAAQEGEVAIVFGTEMSGLTNDELVRCQFMVSIPANPEYSSLNLASAVQLISYELRLAAGLGEIAAPELVPAPAEQLERYFVHLEATLGEIGFLRTQQTVKLMYKLRRLYSRARLEQDEINILRGILTLTSEYHTNQSRKPKQ